ncbi:efflux RND transporter permease subunit [Paraburkholderia sp. SIMBA_055]|jgi:multidrug efflux pump subunit AcrB|uniref:Acriflavin resistance protein n=6 Tax=Burkholderiaceae TaxID=119060 RepID=B1G048_PARG4|nr:MULTISPECIES: efflux RND transporter permease subunit [Paraburkholderia]ALE57456.1 RND transporter [Burkholderia sp. HB1]AXF10282.1 AcrB/AcrD/AcrF family protein [Paraburkholderia graminis]EDT10586.1 acriflavin resistance protein [Paraburkholderia graminis C4D1M]MDR6475386.1 multidrug efflux pump subunit AcrB [Paraburkholderia graminis]PTQ97264.1 multidrug efflux pump subunit AcrB [Paraburkholderia sp. GV072]
MWIVNVALKRPYTFIVMAILIVLATPFVLFTTPVDVLPEINIPVVSIIWTYNGLSAEDMAHRIASVNERSLTTTVNDIEHIESNSLAGITILKVFLQPNANIQTAIAQTVAVEQAQLKQMPPGATPPLVISYSASSIPVIQLGLSSTKLSEQQLNDTALNFLRPQLVTIPGAAVPYPYGGKSRLISVDLNTRALLAKGLTPLDVVSAFNAQNLILPTGTAKIGPKEYTINMNGSPSTLEGLNDIPVRTVNGATTYLREVAHVRDGFSPQTNIVRQDGHRGVLISVLKNGSASTLSIVNTLHGLLPAARAALPPDLNITALFDQSVFVKAAVQGVVHEAVVAAALTAAMILLFLGNWRSTCIIAISIPLSILSSLIALHALGQTINIMTLGGLALAVGILVDDATVTIENIERHLHMGTNLHDAILEGAGEIAIPALVSTLCICIVFVPMFFLTGVARYLFVPLAEAVVFAMLASYILSRTLVPTLAMLLMGHAHKPKAAAKPGLFQRIYRRFDNGFERMRAAYIVILSSLLVRRRRFGSIFLGFCVVSMGLAFVLGEDFFPSVDAGNIRLHMRAPTGTRIEETARLADEVEKVIREVVPANELGTILDNLGLPYSGINLSYSNAGTIGTLDGEIQIALKEGHEPTQVYVDKLRAMLPQRFPGVEFFFQPADIVTQILNFGLPAAVDVQIAGADQQGNFDVARKLLKEVRLIPGTVDTHIQQKLDEPAINLQMDRTRLQQLNLTASNVAQNLLVSLSGSSQTSPGFWYNDRNGVEYNVAVQTPQYRISSIDDLLRTPVSASSTGPTQLLGNLVRVSPQNQFAVVTHYNIRPVIDLYVSVDKRDLGSVANQVDKLVEKARATLPRGSQITVRGQVQTMRTSYLGLGLGVAMAIVLVYLLIVVNFQSWVDPLIIVSALPAALAGIVWMLFLTGTHLSVPALTGAIMTMGVATANSILMVAFARQRLSAGAPPLTAALEAGASRIRPVLMTAFAMIIGMIPMALGLGEGAEQNAPLGRAVIGGLLFATVSTLFFVPLVFAGIHTRLARRHRNDHEDDGNSAGESGSAGEPA